MQPLALLRVLPAPLLTPLLTPLLASLLASLPAPLHLAVGLLRARGLGLADKLAMARLMRHLKARRVRHFEAPAPASAGGA